MWGDVGRCREQCEAHVLAVDLVRDAIWRGRSRISRGRSRIWRGRCGAGREGLGGHARAEAGEELEVLRHLGGEHHGAHLVRGRG